MTPILMALCLICLHGIQHNEVIGLEDNISYNTLKSEIQTEQLQFAKAYSSSGSNKDSIIDAARIYLLNTLQTDLFPAWYGTAWDYEGTTQTPKTGSIACGYFVTTVLRDAGFNIPRVKWAQMASETMIYEMTNDVKKYSNVSAEKVIAEIKTRGEGLYVVGLDIHVGYMLYYQNSIMFIHSNYYQNGIGVMAENPIGDNPFFHSKYRVVGKILGDTMMQDWLSMVSKP